MVERHITLDRMATQGEAASTLVSCVASQLEASDQIFFPGKASDQMYISENKVALPSRHQLQKIVAVPSNCWVLHFIAIFLAACLCSLASSRL